MKLIREVRGQNCIETSNILLYCVLQTIQYMAMSTDAKEKNELSKINVKEIFENAMKDPTLYSTLDIETLLESIENTKNDYLENKTLKSVTDDVFEAVRELNYPIEIEKEIVASLLGYRYVDSVDELHVGKYIRWIRRPKKVGEMSPLTNGAMVTKVKFTDRGILIGCRGMGGRFLHIHLDECVIFQKMTAEEQLILMAYEKIEKTPMLG